MHGVKDWTELLTVHQEIEIEQQVDVLIAQDYLPEESREAAIQVLAHKLVKEIEAGR